MTTRIDSARRKTAGGIPYTLMEGYPQISVEVNGPAKATERYLIRATDLEAFIAESLPVAYVAGTSVYWPTRRRMPGTSILITQSLSFEPHSGDRPADPFGVDGGAEAGTYDDLMVATIEYSTDMESDHEATPRDPAAPETYLEHSVDVGMTMLDCPTKNLYVADLPIGTATPTADQIKTFKALDMPPPKRVPMVTHQFNWAFALKVDWSMIVQTLGKVNQTVLKMFNNAPKETVLFEAVNGRRIYSWNGRNTIFQPWSLTFVFNEIVIKEGVTTYGWNHKWDPHDSKWKKVFRKSGASYEPLYEMSEFRNMFVASV